ncbi:MAG: DUF1269 domain-containing protein, partial [Roseiflexaceae bacterium]|nr:DUF1269 domain-containing protein [Roseiflexaceae bacterium]
MQHEQLIACTWSGADSAARAQAAAQALPQRIPDLVDENIALLTRDATGALAIHETAEAQDAAQVPTVGAVSGWLLGFANTLVGGPLGPAQGGPIGMALGQEQAAEHDTGFSDAFLRELGQTLHRGEAAVLAVVSAEHAQVALALLA